MKTSSEEQPCAEGIPLKLKSPSEEIEDRLLMFSDKIRSFANSESISMDLCSKVYVVVNLAIGRGEWYTDYLSMLSKIHMQQYTCTPVSEHPQTLNWLFSHGTYLAWLRNSEPCMLYIYGQCGIGKTTLSSFLWKTLHAAGLAQEDDAITTLYFSFYRDDKRRMSTKSLLSSIIYQLLACRPQVFLSIQCHFDWIQESLPLTVEELWVIFRALVACPMHEGIICIIDAIDECEVLCDTMLQEFLAFSASREVNFKVIATSRVAPESLHHPPLFTINLDLQKEIGMDMEAGIEIQVRDLLQANAAFLEYEEDIVEEFRKRRTHLEVILGFESLKSRANRSTPCSVKETLQSLRCSPSDVCDRTLNQVTDLPPWARTALSWIMHAFRPLTLDELSLAVAIRHTTTSYSEIENDVPRDIAGDLKQVFGGMLSFSHEEIRFIHPSVKDYLLIHLESPNQNRLLLDLTHFDLARHCLAYLSFVDFEDKMPSKLVTISSRDYPPPGKFDLLNYATKYWPEHYQRAEGKESLDEVVLECFRNAKHLERWNGCRPHGWPRRDRPSPPVSPLQIAAELGLGNIVTTLLSRDGGDSTTQNDKENALDLAVVNNHPEIAVQLLNDGTTSSRALNLAARHGHSELVEYLMHKSKMMALKADGASNSYEVSNTEGTSDGEGTTDTEGLLETDGFSPLHMAALRGHSAIVDIILGADAITEPMHTSGHSPFSLAVKGGQLAVLQQLLAVDNTIALADRTEHSLLHLAAREGHREIVGELIMAGADANAIGMGMSTPLLLAAEGGHLVLVKELISNFGADLKATNEAGSCAVHVAAANGHIQIFEQLCKAGVDIEAKGEGGSQPVHLAAKRGHLRVTKSLLEMGVDPNTVDGHKLAPLHLATMGGHLKIVQELLNHSRSDRSIHGGIKPTSRIGTGGLDKDAGNESKDYETAEDDSDAGTDKSLESLDQDHTVSAENLAEASDESSSTDSVDSFSVSGVMDSNESTPLHSAALRGYVEIARELLKADSQCNIPSKHHLTPLHLAAKEGYLSVVKELLHHNADPNIADENESSPLHAASTAGNLAMVKALISFGAEVSKTNDDHASPLHRAASRGHADVARHLLEAGAEPGATNAMEQTPLHIGISQRHCDVVATLLTNGANPNMKARHGWTALHIAVRGKNIKTGLIMQILQKGADVHASDRSGSTALFLAAESGQEAAVKILLDAGAKADATNVANSTPLHRAAQQGHLAVARLLMEAGANPLAKKRSDITPLQLALEKSHFDVAAQLLEPTNAVFPSIDDYEESLYSLAREGFREGIVKALEYPLCNLERVDSKYQQSPLSHAAENGYESVVMVLLDKGADPNSVDSSGRSPLHWAVDNQHQAVAKQLLERGANVDSKDHDQWTALFLAIQNCSAPMVNLLLDMGADVSAVLDWLVTPLHVAAQYDELAVIRLLVEKGASLSSLTTDQLAPLDFALSFGSDSTVALLLDLGASPSTISPDGVTVLYRAMDRGDDPMVDLLVRRCSDAFVGLQGWTRLHLAALSGDESTVREQLEQGADINVRDRSGLMALHWAAIRSHEDVVQLLLEMNTEVHAKDNEGMTALHHAASRGNERTVKALLEKGAERDVTDLHGWTPFQIAQMYNNDDIHNTLSEDNETVMRTRSGLAPSRWVKAIDSSGTKISEDGLTAMVGKTGLSTV